MTTEPITESGATPSAPRERPHRSGELPADAVREALVGGPREASDVLALLRAAGFSDAQIARAKKQAGAVSERRDDGVWLWRLDFADDLLAVVETEIDCTEQIESQPATRRQRRRVEKLLAKRRRLTEQVSATGPGGLHRELAARLAGVEAELDAIDVEIIEGDQL